MIVVFDSTDDAPRTDADADADAAWIYEETVRRREKEHTDDDNNDDGEEVFRIVLWAVADDHCDSLLLQLDRFDVPLRDEK